ncbi:unnamed protein product, partial [Phaeothamnion confervicola]
KLFPCGPSFTCLLVLTKLKAGPIQACLPSILKVTSEPSLLLLLLGQPLSQRRFRFPPPRRRREVAAATAMAFLQLEIEAMLFCADLRVAPASGAVEATAPSGAASAADAVAGGAGPAAADSPVAPSPLAAYTRENAAAGAGAAEAAAAAPMR